MSAFWRLTWTEAKLFLREPAAAFFTLAFPLLLLFIFGAIFGNEPSQRFGGLGMMDISVPGYMGMIIANMGLMSLPAAVVAYREQGVLRRFRAAPISPAALLGAQALVYLAVQMAGIALLALAGAYFYGLRAPVAPIGAMAALLLSSAGFFAIGLALASVTRTSRGALAIGMGLFFPMLFLSGAAMPRELFPAGVKRFGEILPLTHVVETLKSLWFSGEWRLVSLAVVAGLGLVAAIIAVRAFRWE